MKKRLTYFLLTVFTVLYLASGTLGQTVQGVITGTVTDPSGASVPNAKVTLTNAGTNISQSTTTASDGSYRFSLVPPGNYIIDVNAASFAEVRTSGIVVEASQVIPFSVRLELAKGSQVIEVNGQAPQVQTATSDLSIQIDRATIETAALPDRDVFASLPFLAPTAARGIDGSPAVGGARESGTSYLLNGGDNNDNFSEGAINVHPPLESVQDFSILTNDMGAQYGRGAGAVVSVNQKAGTNRLHGSVYEYNRNDLLNANDFFSNREGLPRTKYVRNQFGGEVDGPIIKDKTFFSFAYDRITLTAGSAAAQTFVPTSAAIAYIQANGGALANGVISARPPVTSDASCPSVDPTGSFTGAGFGYWGNGVPNPVGCLGFSDPQSDKSHNFYGRVDHNFSPKDRLSFAANVYRDAFVNKFGGGPLTTLGPIPSTTTNHFHNLTLSETHSFGPRLFNEVTVAHNRHFNVSAEGNGTKDTVPNILIDNQTGGCLGYGNSAIGTAGIGGDAQGGQIVGFVQDRWGVSDNLTWSAGKHTLRFGGGMQYGIFYRNWDLGLPGQYEFGELTKIDTGNGESIACPAGSIITPACDGTLDPSNGTIVNVYDETTANLAGDYPYFQETSVDPRTGAAADAYRHYTYHDYYWFVQDDWKVTSRLTLNLGLRWDRYGAPSEASGILAQFSRFTCNILDPACSGSQVVVPAKRMWPTQNHDFAPRIGFAWDPTGKGKMAVRGGYGILYDRIFDNIWSNGAWNPPFYALLDFENDLGDAVFYSNPASIGGAYDPTIPGCQIPNAATPNCIGHRVSVRTMDQNMKDSSSQNFYLGIERQFFGGLLVRANYQGAMGRHLPMLENYNRYDGSGYGVASPHSLNVVRPNPLYTGFNYRSNSVSSNYNALVLEAQKHMGHGLEFQTSYAFSKLLDVNSELFAGCSVVGASTAPYYYITNSNQKLSYGRAAFDARHAYKFNVIYELPFLKMQKGFVGHALGGWTVASFFQLYSGHPIDVYNGRTRIRARDASGNLILDQNGVPVNIGGDYNLDGVTNDHPVFVGPSLSNVYSGASPADGIFTNNGRIGCSAPGIAGIDPAASSSQCPLTGINTLFDNPDYPGGSTPFERFGTLGRDVFHGPRFVQMDMSLAKTFQFTERLNLKFSLQAQNLLNHPSFDCIDSNLASKTFGKAQCLAQFGASGQGSALGAPAARIMSVGLRLAF